MNTEPVNCSASELSIYLRALEAGFLPTFYSGTSLFALSSSIRIASKPWRNGKRTGCFHGFPSLPMSASSTDVHGEDSLMSSQAGSHAKTSASQARAQDSTASDQACGATWRGSLATFDPASRSWKTVQRSLLEDSDECSVTWPRSGTTRDGHCWELPTLAPRIDGIESGLLLPTPCATDAKPITGGNLFQTSTGSVRARNADGSSSNRGLAATAGDGLATAVKRESMATPTARDWRSGKASEATHAKNSRPLSEQIGGLLSPDWTELLIGWPKGWTALAPLGSAEMRGWGEGWEDGTDRVLPGVPNRVQRLKAIGNGQVPQCAAEAWRLLA